MRQGLAAALALGGAVLLGTSVTAGNGAQEQGRGREQGNTSPVRVIPLVENGGRLDWSGRTNLIVFDCRVGDGYFDIYTITPSGKDETCLTCGKRELPPKSKGNPSWHPSGDYIVFQAQNTERGFGRITDYFANPGAGINNDLWVMDRQGGRFWQLTHVPPKIGGVLHPQFSPAGDKLFWSERISLKGSWGEWALKVADFVVERDDVRLGHVRSAQPGAQRRMYESHGFSPSGRQVLFSGNLEPGQAETSGDIYLYDFESGHLTNLTQSPKEWTNMPTSRPTERRSCGCRRRTCPDSVVPRA